MTPYQNPRRLLTYMPLITLAAADCLLLLPALQSADSLRTFAFSHIGFVGLIACLVAAMYYARKNQLGAPVPWRGCILTLATLLLLSLLLDLSGATLIEAALAILHRRFQQPYWQAFGLLLAALIFLPIIYEALRKSLRDRRYKDLAVCLGFLLLLCSLYLPFGFNSIAHWENWIYLAHLEGRSSWGVAYELTTRYWVALPHLLATIISPDSFLGFHVTHLLILWGKLVLLYGILRQLAFPRLYAFLATTLFLFYPVNSDLLSLRSLPNQFSALSLMAAGYLIISFRKDPSRLHLLGIWLALSFNVASNETAFAIILVVPLLWLPKNRPPNWKALNLSAIWFLAPLAKLAYFALLAGNSMTFYNSYVFTGDWNPSSNGITLVPSRLADVYRHTLIDSWQAAIHQLGQTDWLGMCAVVSALIAGIAWLLMRNSNRQTMPSTRDLALSFASGILFITPSVGVLIWLEQYSGDLWRTYFYVPIGASIAVFSLVALAAAPIQGFTLRNAAITVLCLAVGMPGIARLFEQREELVTSADNKAILLRNLLNVAPHIEPDTTVLLITDLTREELDAADYYELHYSNELDDSILYVLYNNRVPLASHFCLETVPCPHWDNVTNPTSPNWSEETFQRTLFLKINQDLAIELIKDPVNTFDLDIDIPYDASQLYDPDAPLPPRAETMLAPAIRR